jgi:Kef-type K+ transport system membrane component KefB
VLIPHAIVAPASSASVTLLIVQVAVLLAAASTLGRLAERISIPSVVGQLAAGVLLGPSVFGSVLPGQYAGMFPAGTQKLLFDGVTQIAVVLVVGLAGLHVDRESLRQNSGQVAAVVVPAFLVPMLGGVAFGLLLPQQWLPAGHDRLTVALFLGTALSFSAMPVAASIFQHLGVTRTKAARIALSAAAVIDGIAWITLSLVTGRATGADATNRAGAGLLGLLFVGVVVTVLPRLVSGPLWRLPLRKATSKGRLSAAAAITLMFAGAAVTASLGLESLLGAFTVGVALSACPGLDRIGLESMQEMVRTVLAPLFFAGVGLHLDVFGLSSPADLILCGGLVVLAISSKLLGAGGGALLAGLARDEAVTVAAALNARGAVELIVADLGLRTGILDARWHTAIAIVAVFTSMMAAPLLRWSVRRCPVEPELAKVASIGEFAPVSDIPAAA